MVVMLLQSVKLPLSTILLITFSKPPVKDGYKFFSTESKNGFGQLSLLFDTKESRTVGKL